MHVACLDSIKNGPHKRSFLFEVFVSREVFAMFHLSAIDAVRSASSLAEESKLIYAIYSQENGFIVVPLVQPNGLELEIIKP